MRPKFDIYVFISHIDLINVMRYRVSDPPVLRSLCHFHALVSLHMAAVFNIGSTFERNLQDLSENFNKLHTFHINVPLFPYFAYTRWFTCSKKILKLFSFPIIFRQ